MVNTVKRWIRKNGTEEVRELIILFLRVTGLGNKRILFSSKQACANRVNIHYWSEKKNLGDAISPILVKYAAEQKNIDIDKQVNQTRHLYAVGSILTAGCQDCTVWGSGLLNTRILNRLKNRKLDIRAVRGPLTRMILMDYGFAVPEVYGDPAILMPLIYNPDVEKKYKVGVITHMNELKVEDDRFHTINILTDDYETFIRELKQSELIISSSLHGIILAENYGVPAILLKPKMDMLKYYDFYFGTNRFAFPIAQTLEEALMLQPAEIPDYTAMRDKLLQNFPWDLWEDNEI